MSEEKQRRVEVAAAKGAWGTVFCWTGIYLLRLLIGLVLGAIMAGISITASLLIPTDYHHEFGWGIATVLSALVLTIALVTFLPLWRGLEKECFLGRTETIAATKNLLIPAIGLQLYAAMSGELGWGITNFIVAVGVCYLVTLARNFDRRSQFVMLLIAGAQAIIICLFALISGPMTPTDGWQVKAAVWLGAAPPIVLMVILFFRCSGECGRITMEPPLDAPREAPAIGPKAGALTPTESMAPALEAGAERGYFYVGPGNEPVGPISWAVLLQLRRSGTIADDTFVAREGESDWGPLKPRLAESESPAT